MNIKKAKYGKSQIAILLFASFAVFLSLAAIVEALPYSPGEVLSPTCSPGSANCTVTKPAVSGTNSDITALTGLTSDIVIAESNRTTTLSVNTSTFAGSVFVGTGTPNWSLTDGYLYVTGRSEFDSNAKFEQTLEVVSNAVFDNGFYISALGTGTAAGMNTINESTAFPLRIWGHGSSNQIILTQNAYKAKFFDHGNQAGNNLFVHDGDPDIDNTTYLGVYYNASSSIGGMRVGKGDLSLSASSSIYLSGGLLEKTRTVSASTTVDASDLHINIGVADVSGIYITLGNDFISAGSSTSSKIAYITDFAGGAGTNNIVINTEGSQKINGLDYIILSQDYSSVSIKCDGSNCVMF